MGDSLLPDSPVLVHAPGIPRRKPGGEQRYVHRIHSLLRAGIRTGQLAIGQIIEESILAEELQTSRNATRAALQLLARSGLVVREPGRGTRVTGKIVTPPVDHLWSESFEQQMGMTDLETIEIERRVVRSAPLLTGDSFDVEHAGFLLIDHLVKVGGEPVALRSSYLPLKPNPTAIADRLAELPDVYAEAYDVQLGHQRFTIEAIACDERTGLLLEVVEGTPVLLRQIVFCDLDNRPRLLFFQHYRADRVAFSTTA